MSDIQKTDNSSNRPNSKESSDFLFVVGIGASAGGLNALEELFDNLPRDSGAAFVVIQHLAPDFKSLMKELLERHTRMTVYRVTQGMEIYPNSVYLIPPGKILTVEGNLLRLEERKKNKNDQHEFIYPIDLFFNSLAKNYREKSIGVVLSGSGTDGSDGLKAINKAGGIALAQDPDTAEFEGMPTSAIATGVVDRALPPKELAKLIYECIASPLKFSDLATTDEIEITASDIKTITGLLLETENIDFSYYKISTMSRRIHRRRLMNHFLDLPSYIDLLHKSVEERNILSSDLLINVTDFFRDTQPWKTLENKVLPTLIEQAKPYEELRFWVAACSTGEEAYSLAILIHEALENTDKPLRIKIFATDIDRTALSKASLGVYPRSIAHQISSQRLQKYFLPIDNSYQVVRKLREMLIFSPHDLSKDVGFTRMHLISCRNVLIYMRPHLQQQIIRKLHFSLVVQGVLFLGEAESVGDFDSEFIALDKRWKVYQKRRNVKLSLSRQAVPKVTQTVLNRSSKQSILTADKKSIHEYSLQRILEKSDSAVLLIGKNNQLLHFYGDSSNILKPIYGKIVTDVIQMVTLPLQMPLKMALHRVRKDKKSVVYSNIRPEQKEASHSFRLEAIPPDSNYQNKDLYLVKIETEILYPSSEILPFEKFQVSDEAQQRILELENELERTRENLQALIEELETTNEEQQASNEELTSSNEELQSTNEELHSVNEELHTVNTEYQSKIQELTQLNNDVDNLLKSTDIGVIFLDRELKIRKFTPAATQAVFLRNSDLGRPLTELTPKIDCPQLPELLQKILKSEESIELEVKQKDSDFYLLMQINIYYTEDGCSEGLVISFVKIDEIKNVQIQLTKTLTEKNRQLAAIETSRDGIAILSDDKFVYINQAHLEMFGYHKPEELLGLSWRVLYKPEEVSRLRKEIFPLLQSQGTWQGTAQAKHRQGYVFDEELTLTVTSTGDLICVCRDISDRLKITKSLKESEQRYRNLYEKTPVMLHSIDKEGKIISVSNYWLEKLGYTHEEVIGRKSTDFLTPESRKYAIEYVLPVFLRTGNCQDVLYQWVCKDGRLIDGLLSATSEWDEGKLVRSLAVIVDVTERRQKEQLERVNKAKDAFIAHMSHELRTPLNSILGFSSILKKELSSNPEQFYSIDIINQSGHYLLALINDILDFSKVVANKMQLEPSRLNLIHFLNEISSNFELSAKQKGLKFSLEIGDSVPQTVNVDKIRLRQILFNLLSNAVKFTKAGSVTLKVNTIKDFSDVGIGKREPTGKSEADCPVSDSSLKTVRFQVEDTGRGIPTAKLTSIFIPFEQLNISSADRQEGTGLGLAISRDIVRLMGGKLEVESDVSKGSRFWFDIELAEIEPILLPPTSKVHSSTRQKLNTLCRVLVVDDYKDNRTLLINYLEHYGFILNEASNGQEGLEIAEVFQPEVILVDLAMPIMNGIEMIAKIRQKPDLKNVVIIAVSANSEFILGKSEIDCDGFLPKPVDLELLLETLDNLLQLDWQSSELSEPEQNSLITPPEQQELAKLMESAEIGDISNLKLLLKSLTDQSDRYLTFIQEVEKLINDLRLDKLEEFLQSYL